MQIAQTVEPLQGESQAGKQPHEEQAAYVVMANMLESIAVLGIVEAFVFDMPAALGHAIQTATADLRRGEICKPVGLHHITVRFVLAIADHPRGFPLEAFPRIKIGGVPSLDAIRAVAELQVRRSTVCK
jgi:hypothetical protein